MDPVTQQLDSAIEQIGGAAGPSVKDVDGALGGQGPQAPAQLKGMAYHMAQAPMLFGKKHLAQVFGVGEIPVDGQINANVHKAINLADHTTHRHVSKELKAIILGVKKEIHNAQLQQQILARKSLMPVAVEQTPYWKHVVEPMLKAFQISDFAAWLPTMNTSFYFEELELEPGLEKYFPTLDMPGRTMTVPGALTRLKGRLEGDAATYSAQYNTSSSYTLVAQDCVAHTDITDDLLSDMVPNAGAFERLRREVAMGVARSKEDAIINGDDTIGTSVQGDGHMDSDVAGGAATLFNKGFQGLRKRAIAASNVYANGGSGVSLATINGLIKKLGKNAIEKGDLLAVVGPSIANNLIGGNVSEILTHEKFWNAATIMTGKLPSILGIEFAPSEWVREDVNSSGVYASSQSLTTVLLVKKSRFVIGKRAPLKIWATPSLASSDKLLLTAKERFTFGGVPQSATEKSVAAAVNVALT